MDVSCHWNILEPGSSFLMGTAKLASPSKPNSGGFGGLDDHDDLRSRVAWVTIDDHNDHEDQDYVRPTYLPSGKQT